VELMAAIGLFNYFNRFNNALEIEPTKPGEGAEQSTCLKADGSIFSPLEVLVFPSGSC
jgi:hypothetical protein